MSCVTCHNSHVTCHNSHVTWKKYNHYIVLQTANGWYSASVRSGECQDVTTEGFSPKHIF